MPPWPCHIQPQLPGPQMSLYFSDPSLFFHQIVTGGRTDNIGAQLRDTCSFWRLWMAYASNTCISWLEGFIWLQDSCPAIGEAGWGAWKFAPAGVILNQCGWQLVKNTPAASSLGGTFYTFPQRVSSGWSPVAHSCNPLVTIPLLTLALLLPPQTSWDHLTWTAQTPLRDPN